MSDAVGKKIKLWDGIIEYDEPVPDARTEAVRAAIEARLVEFDHHKEPLLNILRDAHNHSPKSGAGHGPFVRFVCAFLAAIRANVSEEYVVELAQKARSRARTNPSKGGPSPFDD